MSEAAQEHVLVPYGLYVKVWAILVCLTGVTVGASYLEMRNMAIYTALLIAVVKASLVALYFMHVRFEKPLYRYMIFVVIATYAILIGLTLADYSAR